MKIKYIKNLGLIVCLSTMMSSSIQVLANTNNQPEEPTTISTKDLSDKSIQPRDSKVVINQTVYADKNTSVPSYSWVQTQGFEWLRIWYKNESDNDVIIKLDGRLPKTVYAHSEDGYIANPVSAERHTVTVTPINGGVVDGWLGVREGDSDTF